MSGNRLVRQMSPVGSPILIYIRPIPIHFMSQPQPGDFLKQMITGATWTSIFDNAGAPAIGAIAVDPNNGDNILVGTGEANARSR